MMNMYNVRIDIVVVLNWVQSYDIFRNVVSVAYGKYADKGELNNAANQRVTKDRAKYPMESFAKRIISVIQILSFPLLFWQAQTVIQ